MPRFKLEESTYAGPIPQDEVLAAEVTNVRVREKDWTDDDGNKIVKVEFSFVITDDDSPWDGQKIWGETPTTFSTNEKCKLRAWAQEIMGVNSLEPGFELDTDTLIGLPCRVVVAQREKKKDGQPTGDFSNYVQDVLRARSGGAYASVDQEEPF